MQLEISGIPVEIIKKNIKNMHLYVYPPDGIVRVSAPEIVSDRSIELFVRSKLGWIRKQQKRFQNQPRQSKREYVSGESFYLWGQQYYFEVKHDYKKNSLEIIGDKAILNVKKESTIEQREKFINEWYRRLLKNEIAKLLPKWERITGLYCSSWQTKYMITKWGSCNTSTKKIWLNLQLAKKPKECLEYVILHELAHIKVKNHNSDFIELLDSYMPYWREYKQSLNSSKLDYMPIEKNSIF